MRGLAGGHASNPFTIQRSSERRECTAHGRRVWLPVSCRSEYEDRYRLMADRCRDRFYRYVLRGVSRERFLEMSGYDTSFPVACAEDIELSYRMSARGWKMKFAPAAIVYHTHPDTLSAYIKKKYKFAFWRVLCGAEESQQGSERQPHAAADEASASVRASVAACGGSGSGIRWRCLRRHSYLLALWSARCHSRCARSRKILSSGCFLRLC